MELHKHQSQALRASLEEHVPFVLMLSGVQGGKTTAGACWELAQWAAAPSEDHLILAPTYKMLQQSTLRKLDRMIPKGWAEYNKAESCYSLPQGGKAFVRSLEDPDSIEGLSAASIWGDEAGRYSVRAWENIQARRSATRGPVFLTTTPYGLNWLKTDFYDLWLKGLPEYRVIAFRSIDSPHFSREEWERAKRDLAPKVFSRKFGGTFTRLEGLIYEDFDRERHLMEMHAVPRSWQKIGGIDHGFSEGHPAAFGIWASPNFHDPRTKVVKVAEYKAHGRLLEGMLSAIRSLEVYTGEVPIWYADPSAAQENAELRAKGLNVKAAINDVDWGIEQVQKLMRNDRYRLVRERTRQTQDELETYARDEKDRIIKEADHLMDADRYALATHLREPKKVVIH